MVLHLSFAMLLAKEAAVLFFLYYQNFAGAFVPMGNGRGQLNAFFLRPRCPLSFFSWPLSSSEDSGFFRLFVPVLHCLTLCVVIHCCGFSDHLYAFLTQTSLELQIHVSYYLLDTSAPESLKHKHLHLTSIILL